MELCPILNECCLQTLFLNPAKSNNFELVGFWPQKKFENSLNHRKTIILLNYSWNFNIGQLDFQVKPKQNRNQWSIIVTLAHGKVLKRGEEESKRSHYQNPGLFLVIQKLCRIVKQSWQDRRRHKYNSRTKGFVVSYVW